MQPRTRSLVGRMMLGGLVVLLCGTPTTADVLVPAALVALGAVLELHLIPAILIVEALIAKRVLGVSLARSLILALAANAVSGLVGVPLIAPLFALNTRGSLDSGAWLLLVLCVPSCLLSIWVEARVAAQLLRAHSPRQCALWSREANLASYSIVAGVSLALLIAGAVFRRRGLY